MKNPSELEETEWGAALGEVRKALEPQGWTVVRSRRAIKARWRWFRVVLRHKPKRSPAAPWRAQLRDDTPFVTLNEAWGVSPTAALEPVVAEAFAAQCFCDGRLGLVPNPSKSWLAHRLLGAVHPIPPRRG